MARNGGQNCMRERARKRKREGRERDTHSHTDTQTHSEKLADGHSDTELLVFNVHEHFYR